MSDRFSLFIIFIHSSVQIHPLGRASLKLFEDCVYAKHFFVARRPKWREIKRLFIVLVWTNTTSININII